MRTVEQILDTKGHDIWSIEQDASVFEAIELMAKKEVGALLVTKSGNPVGMISERDYARQVILKGLSSKETLIQDIMATRVVYAHPDGTVEECMALMTEKHIRHLPVINDEHLLGMISIGDLVKAIIAEQQLTIERLESYISS
jgi:CBS domain-containing protein